MRSFLRARWKAISIAGACALLALYVGTALLIGHQVNEVVDTAQARSPGEPVAALLAMASSPSQGLAERNRAVWALGQLGDSMALETLESLYSGQGCDHSVRLCQRELRKAIRACEGGFNVGALVWRHGRLDS